MSDWYEPGFKAGGPIRSVVNFVEHFKDRFEIRVFTTDRDLGDLESYPGIVADQWVSKNGFSIFYSSPEFRSWSNIRKIIQEKSFDFLYLNSMFSVYNTIIPVMLKKMGLFKASIVLSPRGMLRSSALDHKSQKKYFFLRCFRLLLLERKIFFHATDDIELEDISRVFPHSLGIKKIPNLPGKQFPFTPAPLKKVGELFLIFVGRIHPIKNLDYLLKVLNKVEGQISLTIVAANDDQKYRQEIDLLIKELPSSITVQMINDLPHSQLEEVILKNHVFALPTKGENFGHAIFESLAAGRPVVISDQTPWRKLQAFKAGFDIPLENNDQFVAAFNFFSRMGNEDFQEWCISSWQFCNRKMELNEIRSQYIEMFSNN